MFGHSAHNNLPPPLMIHKSKSKSKLLAKQVTQRLLHKKGLNISRATKFKDRLSLVGANQDGKQNKSLPSPGKVPSSDHNIILKSCKAS